MCDSVKHATRSVVSLVLTFSTLFNDLFTIFALNSTLPPGNIRVRFGFGLEFHTE
jgi:hypothetical protein